MHERSRLAYLDALGVVSWVPRERVSHAAERPPAQPPSPDIAPSSAVEAEPMVVESPPLVSLAAEQPVVDRSGEASSPERVSEPEHPQPAAQGIHSPTMAPFYLQLWLAGPCALLLQISEPGLEKATKPYRLLTDILRAAGLPDHPVLFADFQWPLTRNPQFDRGAVAASQALSAFVQARLEDQAVVSIGCFGSRCTLLADADPTAGERLMGREEAIDGLAPVWFAAGLEELMGSAAEKTKLWTLLKRVMPRWKERG